MNRMLILPGNDAPAGKYPDEQGNKIAWPTGALHRDAAKEYAMRKGYVPEVLEISGRPQGENSPQANKAVELFLPDQSVTAFYGFSGGGINVMYILDRLASNNPETLSRIDLVVVLGAPEKKQEEYETSKYNKLLEKYNKRLKTGATPAKLATWVLERRINPPPDHPVVPQVPQVPKPLDSHMFGPEWLLWLLSSEAFVRRHPSLLGGPGPLAQPSSQALGIKGRAGFSRRPQGTTRPARSEVGGKVGVGSRDWEVNARRMGPPGHNWYIVAQGKAEKRPPRRAERQRSRFTYVRIRVDALGYAPK